MLTKRDRDRLDRLRTQQAKGTRPPLRGFINLFCKECIYDSYARGTWRMQVEICTARNCPLYTVRPRFKRRVSEEVLRDHPLIVREIYVSTRRSKDSDSDYGSDHLVNEGIESASESE